MVNRLPRLPILLLPLLVLLGLSPDVANGTNRVAIVLQSSVAVATFLRRGVLGSPAPPRALANLGLPLLLGAAVGAGLASLLDPDWFRKILGLVLLMLGVHGLSRIRHRGGGDAGQSRPPYSAPSRMIILCLVGVYAGFIQVGVGVWLLILLPGLVASDLLEANALKSLLILLMNGVALFVFMARGQVDWAAAGWLSLGSGIGAWVGARWASEVSEIGLRWALVIATVILGFRMLS